MPHENKFLFRIIIAISQTNCVLIISCYIINIRKVSTEIVGFVCGNFAGKPSGARGLLRVRVEGTDRRCSKALHARTLLQDRVKRIHSSKKRVFFNSSFSIQRAFCGSLNSTNPKKCANLLSDRSEKQCFSVYSRVSSKTSGTTLIIWGKVERKRSS